MQFPLLSSYAKSPDTQSGGELIDAKASPISTSLNEDIRLDAFFSTSSSVNDSIPPVSIQKQLLRRCSWEVRSAVAKRTDLFRRTLMRSSPLANKEASETHPPVSILPPLTSGVTKMSLPGSVSCSLLSPRIPDTGHPLRPFRPDGSFASALLAQRRKIGCAEEESFVAVGTGEEEIPESLISKDDLVTRKVLSS
ncbi:hypothetical protein FBUS_04101 [Fasciolopsis buskii]|uniref:Uncharacterized protein n=1 Tax=Fasciolopsis buskii TaxID=27845 RepID=A0A8E0RNE8_9TREM|nr:hypothetical protein FBUS_04101 [Fasciolopsis buski]